MTIKNLWAATLLVALLTVAPTFAEENEPGVVELSADARAANGITTTTAGFRGLSGQVRMPAEVVINAYASSSVTTRVPAQVIKRHVKLGNLIEADQQLVTLSSVEMAEAQGALIVADLEWQRMRALGKGELIDPGRVMFIISDEATLWVEASTVPSDLTHFEIGAPARIAHGDDHWINGRVVQLHHQLDEITRRQGLRIEVDSSDDHLHPGQFVEAEISTGEGPEVLAVPSEAVTLVMGVPTVFLLKEAHKFEPQSVDSGESSGGWTEIRGGLSDGDEIAVTGVFHIKSLLLKSSLGEGHAH